MHIQFEKLYLYCIPQFSIIFLRIGYNILTNRLQCSTCVGDAPPIKKIKNEPEDEEETKLIKKQNDELYAIKDKISSLEKNDLIAILEKNGQQIPTGTPNVKKTCTLKYVIILLVFAFLNYVIQQISKFHIFIFADFDPFI